MESISFYFDEHVVPCEKCTSDGKIAPYMTFSKLPPFEGGQNSSVLLLGHSPKVRTSSRISTTLDLDEDRQLRRYIRREVLEPLSIELKWCSATNIVKCLTTEMPEDISLSDADFMERVFAICNRHLIQEMSMVRIKLVISFSEKVSDLLQIYYSSQEKPRPMKEIFATLRELEVGGRTIAWIPVVHIPKAKVRVHYFPEQTIRLQSLKSEIMRILD